jgi:hypothetical protein
MSGAGGSPETKATTFQAAGGGPRAWFYHSLRFSHSNTPLPLQLPHLVFVVVFVLPSILRTSLPLHNTSFHGIKKPFWCDMLGLWGLSTKYLQKYFTESGNSFATFKMSLFSYCYVITLEYFTVEIKDLIFSMNELWNNTVRNGQCKIKPENNSNCL